MLVGRASVARARPATDSRSRFDLPDRVVVDLVPYRLYALRHEKYHGKTAAQRRRRGAQSIAGIIDCCTTRAADNHNPTRTTAVADLRPRSPYESA